MTRAIETLNILLFKNEYTINTAINANVGPLLPVKASHKKAVINNIKKDVLYDVFFELKNNIKIVKPNIPAILPCTIGPIPISSEISSRPTLIIEVIPLKK